jgi:hypothetical protein
MASRSEVPGGRKRRTSSVALEADDRDLHKPDQRPKEHDGEVAVSHFPQAQRDYVVRDERNTDSPSDQRGDKPEQMKAAAYPLRSFP